jgi:hypothetical protein
MIVYSQKHESFHHVIFDEYYVAFGESQHGSRIQLAFYHVSSPKVIILC